MVQPAAARLLLSRHGETEWNRVGRRQGRLDSPLTASGRRDAEKVAELSWTLGADAIFCSPLGRAVATATVVAHRLSLPVVVLDDLAELDHGAFSGLTDGEINRAFPGQLARRAESKYTWRFPGGESYQDAEDRAVSALGVVASRGFSAPLVVAHEMIGRMILRSVLDVSPTEALNCSVPHGCVLELHHGEARSTLHTV